MTGFPRRPKLVSGAVGYAKKKVAKKGSLLVVSDAGSGKPAECGTARQMSGRGLENLWER